MAQVALPQTIDAGTVVAASEVQSNFIVLRDSINGDLEGGTGANFKANGVTAREIADALMLRGLPAGNLQEGVFGAGDLRVTPGANLVLNYASGIIWVQDDSSIIASGALIPVVVTGASVAIGANATGNPRIDQIILTMSGYGTGTVSVLAGTATAGATLANRTGAAALPNDAVRLADVLMPNAFAGPFVQNTHIRDRRQSARGYRRAVIGDNSANYQTASTSFVVVTAMSTRAEFSGNFSVKLSFIAGVGNTAAFNAIVALFNNGAELQRIQPSVINGNFDSLDLSTYITPSAGSSLLEVYLACTGGTAFIVNSASNRPAFFIEEQIGTVGSGMDNSGA